MKSTIDCAGPIVIPRALRKAASLNAGAEVDIRVVDGKMEITAAVVERTRQALRRAYRRAYGPAARPNGELEGCRSSDRSCYGSERGSLGVACPIVWRSSVIVSALKISCFSLE